jgi:hypothetical protein
MICDAAGGFPPAHAYMHRRPGRAGLGPGRAQPRRGAILGRSMQSMAGITQKAPAARRR